MALTKGDDFPIHQTSEPIAYAGTDRNFYDRYFFNGYAYEGELFFAVAMGVYPHLNIADASLRGGARRGETALHASRWLGMERMDLSVGPITIEVLEPLQRLRLKVDAPDKGIRAEIVFEGRAFPIEEPRFIRRNGPRTFMDYTRLTQNGRYSGWLEIDGKRRERRRLRRHPRPLVGHPPGRRARSAGAGPAGADAVLLDLVADATSRPARSSSTPTTRRSGEPWNRRAVWARDGVERHPARRDQGLRHRHRVEERHAARQEGGRHAARRGRRAEDQVRAAVRVLHAGPRLRAPEVGPRPEPRRAGGRARGLQARRRRPAPCRITCTSRRSAR